MKIRCSNVPPPHIAVRKTPWPALILCTRFLCFTKNLFIELQLRLRVLDISLYWTLFLLVIVLVIIRSPTHTAIVLYTLFSVLVNTQPFLGLLMKRSDVSFSLISSSHSRADSVHPWRAKSLAWPYDESPVRLLCSTSKSGGSWYSNGTWLGHRWALRQGALLGCCTHVPCMFVLMCQYGRKVV